MRKKRRFTVQRHELRHFPVTSAITHFSCELLSDISQFVTVGSLGEVC